MFVIGQASDVICMAMYFDLIADKIINVIYEVDEFCLGWARAWSSKFKPKAKVCLCTAKMCDFVTANRPKPLVDIEKYFEKERRNRLFLGEGEMDWN